MIIVNLRCLSLYLTKLHFYLITPHYTWVNFHEIVIPQSACKWKRIMQDVLTYFA